MNLKNKIKEFLNEASSDSGGRGSYVAPLQPGIRPFKKQHLQPFNIPVSKYDSPMLEFDSYDGKMDETPKQIKKIEKTAEKVTNKIRKNPYLTFSDDDGNVINQTPGKNLISFVRKNNFSVLVEQVNDTVVWVVVWHRTITYFLIV